MRASSAALLLLALCGAAAASPPGPTVVLLDARGELSRNDAALHALAELRRALGARGAVPPTPTELADIRDARVDPTILATAERLRQEAALHFRRLESSAASRKLEEASVLHLRRFADVFGDPDAARAAHLAAAIERSDGRLLRMHEELRRAIAFDPVESLDPGQYPPELVDAYATERAYLLAAGIPYPAPMRLCESALLLGARVLVLPVPNAAATQETLSLDVYDPATCTRRVIPLPLLQNAREVDLAAARVLGLDPGDTARAAVGPPRRALGQPPPPATETPWYGRWYTLAGAGALIAGGIAAALFWPAGDPDLSANVR